MIPLCRRPTLVRHGVLAPVARWADGTLWAKNTFIAGRVCTAHLHLWSPTLSAKDAERMGHGNSPAVMDRMTRLGEPGCS